jgi:hypothetical protein
MPLATVVGFGASMGLLVGKHMQGELTAEGVDDRAYRLIHSAGQNQVDAYSAMGATVGAVVGAVLGRHALASVLATSLTGVAAGVLVHGVETMGLPALRKRGLLPPPTTDDGAGAQR